MSRRMLSEERLEELVEEATVDAYDEYEQRSGFSCAIGDNLVLPFETEVLGVKVAVVAIDMARDNQIVAVCVRGGSRQRIPILELPLPDPPPGGVEWIEAYRYWSGGADYDDDGEY